MTTRSFSAQVAFFGEKTKKKVQEVQRWAVLESYSRMVTRSPVDTGLFKGSWGIQKGSPYSVQPGGMEVALEWKDDGSMFIANNLPYAVALEYGHSKQAPNGVARITAAEIGAEIEAMAMG